MATPRCNPNATLDCEEIIEVRWVKHGTMLAISTRRTESKGCGRSWVPFGDPLPFFADGFEVHDIYHFLFAERFGWSPVLRRYFFHSDPDPMGPSRPTIVQPEEACSRLSVQGSSTLHLSFDLPTERNPCLLNPEPSFFGCDFTTFT